MSKICEYPGCDVVLSRSTKGRTCRTHRHAPGLCGCAKCVRRDETVRILRACADEGLTALEALERVDVGLSQVCHLAALYNIPLVKRWERAERVAKVELVPARAAPPPSKPVRRAGSDPLASIYHPKWSPADDLLLLRDRSDGVWFAVIATDMDRGVAEVQQRWHRLRALQGIEGLIEDHVKAGADSNAPWPDPSEVAA